MTTTVEMPEPLRRARVPVSAILTIGFGTAIGMWGSAYAGRLPAVSLPSPVMLLVLLACLVAGGFAAGRSTAGGWASGAMVGLVAGLLNLLVLGSLLTGDDPNRLVPSALWWLPGSLLVSAGLGGLGAIVGTRGVDQAVPVNWTNRFVWVTVCATLLLLAAGGLVTSAEAGLAVDDWPTSFGYNMFLYPLSRMTGGIYYEHAHRLVGALVGLTTLVLALILQRNEPRKWVRLLGWATVVTVIVQGLLGGLRVTGRSLPLAMTHGVLAQLFFGTLVALGAITSSRWRSAELQRPRGGIGRDRLLGGALIASLVAQLALGAAQRHFQALLIAHIAIGLGLVAPLAIHVGFRSWALSRDLRLLSRLGMGLVAAVCLQVLLGFGALIATTAATDGTLPVAFDLTVATAHQWFGAVLLATGVSLICWTYRLVSPEATQNRS